MSAAELCTAPDASAPAGQSCDVLARIDQRVAHLERRFGRARLLNTVARFDKQHFAEHTDYYRSVIRRHRWPNVERESRSASEFISGFARSILAYVNVGFLALKYLANEKNASLSETHRWVAAAEALRGQFGKQSPDGLDAWLDRISDQLSAYVTAEEDLVSLGTPTGSLRSAEAALPEDLESIRSLFPCPPTINDIGRVNREQGNVLWGFLRRHARWNLDTLQKYYNELDISSTGTTCGREHRNTAALNRQATYRELPERARTLADDLVSLNFLNLALEPSFGFKGCVGVPIGIVFRRMEALGESPMPSHERLVDDKWSLLNDPFLVGD
jgi:hypothetical protein